MLVNKCKIYYEDNKAIFAHYRSVSEKENVNYICGKLYMTLVDKRNQKFQRKAASGSGTSNGDIFAPLRCFKC